jgi:hypothetical protein
MQLRFGKNILLLFIIGLFHFYVLMLTYHLGYNILALDKNDLLSFLLRIILLYLGCHMFLILLSSFIVTHRIYLQCKPILPFIVSRRIVFIATSCFVY